MSGFKKGPCEQGHMKENKTEERLLNYLDKGVWTEYSTQALDQLKEIVRAYPILLKEFEKMKIERASFKEQIQQKPIVTKEFLIKLIDFIENKGWKSLEGGWHLKKDGENIDAVIEMVEEELNIVVEEKE